MCKQSVSCKEKIKWKSDSIELQFVLNKIKGKGEWNFHFHLMQTQPFVLRKIKLTRFYQQIELDTTLRECYRLPWWRYCQMRKLTRHTRRRAMAFQFCL